MEQPLREWPELIICQVEIGCRLTWQVIAVVSPTIVWLSAPWRPWSPAAGGKGLADVGGLALAAAIPRLKYLACVTIVVEIVTEAKRHPHWSSVFQLFSSAGIEIACNSFLRRLRLN